MPDRRRLPPPRTPQSPDALTAAAALVAQQQSPSANNVVFRHDSWQDEAWGFYDSLGEFNYGVTWLSSAMSRLRLMAAAVTPGGDEPEPITDGPAADIVQELGGGVSGHSAILKNIAVQLAVPGAGW